MTARQRRKGPNRPPCPQCGYVHDDNAPRPHLARAERRPVPEGNPPNRWEHERDLPAAVSASLTEVRHRYGWPTAAVRRALGVECTVCGAPVGVPCVENPWRYGVAHVQRQEAAAREAGSDG